MTEEVIVEVPKEGEKPVSAEQGGPAIEGEGSIAPVETPQTPETASERVEGKYQELLSRATPVASPSNTDDDDTAVLDAKHIGALTDEASKVQKLLDLAQTKGVVHAVKVARSLRDYYVLDTMHDELSGKLYQGMLEKGLIRGE
ncbi:MAG: hypothetical protein KBD27_00385 [Candidatus Moranbacteria bacterium]|nr:hypothetical protein [Candidatus Moranbacteria bacterium]